MIAATDWTIVIAVLVAATMGCLAGFWIGPASQPPQVDVDLAVIEAIADAVVDQLDEREIARVALPPSQVAIAAAMRRHMDQPGAQEGSS